MFCILANYNAFEYNSGDDDEDKSNDTHQQRPGDLVIFLIGQVSLIVRVKFIDIGGHRHVSEGHHHCGYSKECIVKSKLFFVESAFPGKKPGIKEPDSKAKINYNRGDDALPADATHAVKLSGESSIHKQRCFSRCTLSFRNGAVIILILPHRCSRRVHRVKRYSTFFVVI